MYGSGAQLRSSDVAKKMVGSKIVRIDRVLYEFGGILEEGDGPLEVHMEDGSVFLFDGAADGDSLRVKGRAWTDPFEPPLSAENEAFVLESGKWSRVPVSKEALYDEVIGSKIKAVELLENEFGVEAGLAIETDSRTIWFVVRGDESHVFWAFPLRHRTRARFSP